MELNGKVVDGVKDEQEEDTQSRKSGFSSTQQVKAAKILEACKRKDTKTLRALAASEGGLLSDELRRQACR
jgi:TBC1 domain family member 20